MTRDHGQGSPIRNCSHGDLIKDADWSHCRETAHVLQLSREIDLRRQACYARQMLNSSPSGRGLGRGCNPTEDDGRTVRDSCRDNFHHPGNRDTIEKTFPFLGLQSVVNVFNHLSPLGSWPT